MCIRDAIFWCENVHVDIGIFITFKNTYYTTYGLLVNSVISE